MLSILIPVYNYNVLPLASELVKQFNSCGITFEIIFLDDAWFDVIFLLQVMYYSSIEIKHPCIKL